MKAPPQPIEGIAFGRSAAKTFGFFVLNVLVFVVGAFLIWAKFTNQVIVLGGGPKEVNWWGLLIGIVAVLITPGMAVKFVRSLWVRRRVVVGADRLQMVEHLGGQDVVILEIPFANVAWAGYEATARERRVGIDLIRLDDPHTYAKKDNFETTKGVYGRHLYISVGYQSGPRAIATAIERALADWAERQTTRLDVAENSPAEAPASDNPYQPPRAY